MVARWYGGVLLGPVRFEHVEACVRGAVEGWRRREEEGREREKLVKELEERDRRIVVLRGLVVEWEDRVKRTIVKGIEMAGLRGSDGEVLQEGREVKPTPPPPVGADYNGMELERLRALDRARDATVAFLLRRIDKAEADLAALQEGSSSPPPPPD